MNKQAYRGSVRIVHVAGIALGAALLLAGPLAGAHGHAHWSVGVGIGPGIVPPPPPVVYAPPPPVYYQSPPSVYYQPPPVIVYRSPYYGQRERHEGRGWRNHERHEWREHQWRRHEWREQRRHDPGWQGRGHRR